MIGLSHSPEFFRIKDGVWKVVHLLVSNLENWGTEQYSTVQYCTVEFINCDVQFFNLSTLPILIPLFRHLVTGADEPGCLSVPGKSASLTVCLLCRSLSAQ